ncbi:MAG: V-type ATP synthase subunit E [Spirochaetae bacterium HGW-Spirochaetae-8]|jgi:V/A-type H+-transporting ATPase subunit E|nr:MAG: V-type ATP synthase subunit E [Spirochaetae bacterium HGW-Spirochaetae-8]
MELQIQDLVESIKRDGISEASKHAAEIIAEAKAKADEIVRSSTKDAAKIIEDARKEVAIMHQSGRAAVEQASRDVLLSLRKSIQLQLDSLLEQELSRTISGENLIALIVGIVQSGVVEVPQSSVDLNQENLKSLASTLKIRLANELKSGLVLRPVESVKTGFRISEKDGKSFYAFTDEELASLMTPFLNPMIQEIVFDSSKKR